MIRTTFAFAVFAAAASAQVSGPVVGWVWSDESRALRAVRGIPGSSVLEAPYEAGFTASAGVVSASSEWALLLKAADQTAHLVSLRDESTPRALSAAPGVTRGWLSPTGATLALAYADSRKLLLLQNPGELAAELDLSNEGIPDEVAIADDASGVVALYRDRNIAFAIRADGNRWKLEALDGVRTATFFENSGDLLIAGAQGTAVISGVFGDARINRVREGNSLAAAPSRSTALVLEEGGLFTVDIASGTAQALECSCEPSTVARLSNSVFRLNALSAGPLWLADLSTSAARTVFVPAVTNTEQ